MTFCYWRIQMDEPALSDQQRLRLALCWHWIRSRRLVMGRWMIRTDNVSVCVWERERERENERESFWTSSYSHHLIMIMKYIHSFGTEVLPLAKIGNIFGILTITIPVHSLSGRVFANGPGDRSSISGRVIPKIQKVVLDTSLLNTQG